MSRDGWVQKSDLWALSDVARLRAAVNSRNIAISNDGKWLAVANYLPHTLTILDASDLSVARIMPVVAKDGAASRVSAVCQAPTRDSFVLALRDVAEIGEVAASPDAEQVYEGFAHTARRAWPRRCPPATACSRVGASRCRSRWTTSSSTPTIAT